MTNRNDVARYLPNEIRNKRLIFPIVCNLLRKLLDKSTPKIIFRETTEVLSGESLMRYDEITKILTEEYMYKLFKKVLDENGKYIWGFELAENIEENAEDGEMKIYLPPYEERKKQLDESLNRIINSDEFKNRYKSKK